MKDYKYNDPTPTLLSDTCWLMVITAAFAFLFIAT